MAVDIRQYLSGDQLAILMKIFLIILKTAMGFMDFLLTVKSSVLAATKRCWKMLESTGKRFRKTAGPMMSSEAIKKALSRKAMSQKLMVSVCVFRSGSQGLL